MTLVMDQCDGGQLATEAYKKMALNGYPQAFLFENAHVCRNLADCARNCVPRSHLPIELHRAGRLPDVGLYQVL